jgi:hypothetical protein
MIFGAGGPSLRGLVRPMQVIVDQHVFWEEDRGRGSSLPTPVGLGIVRLSRILLTGGE